VKQVLLILALSGAPLFATDVALAQIAREGRILVRIIETAMEDSRRENEDLLRVLSADTTYLAGQGLVLTVRLENGRGSLFPARTLHADSTGSAYGLIFEVDSEAREERMKALEALAQKKQELNKAVEAGDAAKKEALERRLEAIRLDARVLDAANQETRKKHLERWGERQKTTEEALVSVLCDYGTTIRSLPDDQYLTLVFPKQKLRDCRDGRIASVASLIAGIEQYAY